MPLYNILRRHVKQRASLRKSTLPIPDLPVPENEKLLAWVGDEIVPRESAKVLLYWIFGESSWRILTSLSSQFMFLMHNFVIFFKVSVFDSVVQGGDSVWEGLRIYSGKIFKLEEHLDRLVKEN